MNVMAESLGGGDLKKSESTNRKSFPEVMGKIFIEKNPDQNSLMCSICKGCDFELNLCFVKNS
jgi:hypothetical protein